MSSAHDPHAEEDDLRPGSERGFGIVFAVVFAVIGLLPLLGGQAPRWWSLALAALFLITGYRMPRLLAPLNRLWFRFGLLLHRVMTPLILGLMYVLAVVPTGLLLRLFGKDLLALELDREAPSYWIERKPPGPPPESLRNQF